MIKPTREKRRPSRLETSKGPRKDPGSRYYAPALEKGLDVLEALSQANVPQTLADLARSCHRTPSQLFRMIDALEKRSYIAREPVSGGYELTLKLYKLAHTHSPVDQLIRAAQLPMRSLSKVLYESCHLCVLSDYQVLVIAEEHAPTPIRLSIEVGHRVSPFDAVSGHVLIAHMNPDEQAQFLEQDEEFLKWKPARRKLFQSELAQIREQGFAVVDSSVRTGVDVSCFVGSAKLGLAAALGIPFIAGGRNAGREKMMIPVIQTHAKLITEALGWGAEH